MPIILKYAVPITDDVHLEMPHAARILAIMEQYPREIYLWALVDPAVPVGHRHLRIYGTGRQVPPELAGAPCFTVRMLDGQFMWHVFDLGDDIADPDEAA